jgi:hypothetical protein
MRPAGRNFSVRLVFSLGPPYSANEGRPQLHCLRNAAFHPKRRLNLMTRIRERLFRLPLVHTESIDSRVSSSTNADTTASSRSNTLTSPVPAATVDSLIAELTAEACPASMARG